MKLTVRMPRGSAYRHRHRAPKTRPVQPHPASVTSTALCGGRLPSSIWILPELIHQPVLQEVMKQAKAEERGAKDGKKEVFPSPDSCLMPLDGPLGKQQEVSTLSVVLKHKHVYF